jgi:hypothetical protein
MQVLLNNGISTDFLQCKTYFWTSSKHSRDRQLHNTGRKKFVYNMKVEIFPATNYASIHEEVLGSDNTYPHIL